MGCGPLAIAQAPKLLRRLPRRLGAEFFGSTLDFSKARFTGGTLDFSRVDDWSVLPAFPWTDTPPPGIKLPKKDESEVQRRELVIWPAVSCHLLLSTSCVRSWQAGR